MEAKHFAFGSGSRACLGKNIATLILLKVMATACDRRNFSCVCANLYSCGIVTALSHSDTSRSGSKPLTSISSTKRTFGWRLLEGMQFMRWSEGNRSLQRSPRRKERVPQWSALSFKSCEVALLILQSFIGPIWEAEAVRLVPGWAELMLIGNFFYSRDLLHAGLGCEVYSLLFHRDLSGFWLEFCVFGFHLSGHIPIACTWFLHHMSLCFPVSLKHDRFYCQSSSLNFKYVLSRRHGFAPSFRK